MPEDLIVAETRALREEVMRDAGDTLEGLFDHLRKRQALHPERLVSFEAKRTCGPAVDARRKTDI